MLLHHEAYRLLTRERMDRYLSEAAGDRWARLAARRGEREEGRRAIAAPARMLRAAVRALMPRARDKGTPCAEAGRNPS